MFPCARGRVENSRAHAVETVTKIIIGLCVGSACKIACEYANRDTFGAQTEPTNGVFKIAA